MMEMTREQVVGLIRKKVTVCGTLRNFCARQGVNISTMSNILHGRTRFTPRVLRLLGLEHVRIVDQAPLPVVPVSLGRPHRKMWRMGDWPSRYRFAE